MDSIVAFTDEIDDLDVAIQEITEQIKNFKFLKNSFAIIYAEEETDYLAFYERFKEKFSFPLVGCTAMATLLGDRGFKALGISIMFLTADDCEFSVGISSRLTADNYEVEIEKLYGDLVSKLSQKPKLMISFGSIVNDENDVDADYVLSKLDEISGNIPICGALASDSFTFGNYCIFCNDKAVKNAQIVILISGNVEPRTICVSSLKNKVNFSHQVSQSYRNHVYRIDNETFVDALRKGDLLIDHEASSGQKMVLGDYILSPFIITMKYPSGDTVEVVRNLSFLNYDNGSGTFLGTVPEGSIVSISILNRGDVQNTVKNCFEEVMDLIKADQNRYKTILCFTCCARSLALGSNIEGEAQAYEGLIPDDVSLLGIYSYGEYCPVKGNKTSSNYNMFQNFTFSLLLL